MPRIKIFRLNRRAEEASAYAATIGFFDGVHLGHRYIINKVESLQAEEELRQEKEKRTTLIEWIETFIRQCETGERLKRKSTRTITDGTIKSYKGTLAQIKAYQEKRHRIVDFDDVTLDFYDDWRRFFLQKRAPCTYNFNDRRRSCDVRWISGS